MKHSKTKRIFLTLGIILALSIAIRGCYSKKKLENPNPTSYIFEASIEQVKNAVKSGFGDYQMKCMALYLKGDMDCYTFIYEDSKNVNDALLDRLCDIESKIYYKFGNPLPYGASFHIHLDSISENKTKVEVFTLNPKIVLGVIMFGNIGHGHARVKEVPPSTIEDYEILLSIGEQLGEKGMPKCNYPK